MAKLGNLIVNIGVNTKSFNKQLGHIQRSARRSFGNISKLGRSMSTAITLPVAAMAATSVNAFRKQEKAIAQVNAGLKSTGEQVGFTSKELQKMASDLQKNTLFGDEEILTNATAQLLTFTNITGEQFDRTQKAALDLATRLGGDLKGASIQLGKALNDPVANLSALSRSGIQFSTEQKEVIKSLAETGRLAEAQTLILDELNKQYGGSAEAAAKADGGITQLKNAFGDLQEEIGEIVMQGLKPVIKFLREAIDRFRGLSDTTKTVITTLGLVAAAIGPILFILPQLASVASTVGPILGAAFTAMTGPIGIAIMAIAAIGAAILYFWEDVKEPLTNVVNKFIEIYNESAFVRVAVEYLRFIIATQMKMIKQNVMNVIDSFALLFDVIHTGITQGFGPAMDVLVQGVERLAKNIIDTGISIGEDFMNGMKNAITREPLELVTEESLTDAKNKFLDLFKLFENTAESTVVKVKTKVKGEIVLDLDEFEEEEIFEDDLDFDPVKFMQKLERLRAMTKGIMEDIQMSVQRAGAAFAEDLGAGIGAVLSGATQGLNLMGTALSNLADMLQDIGRSMIRQAMAMIAFQKTLFKNPVVAAAAGVAFVAAGVALKNKAEQLNAPALAQGGVVFGPTMALVGDNKNAAIDPEVVAPLSKLKDMMGSNQVQVFGRIQGNDIYLSNARTGTSRNRYA